MTAAVRDPVVGVYLGLQNRMRDDAGVKDGGCSWTSAVILSSKRCARVKRTPVRSSVERRTAP